MNNTIKKQIGSLAVGAVIGILLAVCGHMGFLAGLALAAVMSGIFYFPALVVIVKGRIGLGVLTFIVLIVYMFIMATGDHGFFIMLPLIAVPACVVVSIMKSRK